jgi:hypothetical protein
LAVDYKADQFRLATLGTASVTPNPVPFGTNSTIECPEVRSTDAKTIGFAVAFSILAAVLLVLGIIWYLRRRRQLILKQQGQVANDNGLESYPELIEVRPTNAPQASMEIVPVRTEASELSGDRPVVELGRR